MKIRIGTRGSRLALKQAQEVKEIILSFFPELHISIVTIKTTGDIFQEKPILDMPDKGVFIKEIENALLKGDIDLAVHSLKDMPTQLPEGLSIGAIPPRYDPSDVLITIEPVTLENLKPGSRIGTSSLRRKAQILFLRNDLNVVPLRGNVDTRLRKLDNGEIDAMIIANAGIRRLGVDAARSNIQPMPFCMMLPAPGQGALGIEIRSGELQNIMYAINHPASYAEVTAERSLLKALGGGCRTPIACLGRAGKNMVLYLEAMVSYPDGSGMLKANLNGKVDYPEDAGHYLADILLSAGANKIIESLEKEH